MRGGSGADELLRQTKDAASQLRSATRRAKSDVANKLLSMFLHELSRNVSRNWAIRVDSEEYERQVRGRFENRCPYCQGDLTNAEAVIEHLDGMTAIAQVFTCRGMYWLRAERAMGRKDETTRSECCPSPAAGEGREDSVFSRRVSGIRAGSGV